MKQVLDKISSNFTERFKGLEFAFERYKDWEVLKRTLNLRPQSCYELFGMGNIKLEEVEYLVGLFINCFLDDATMSIKTITDYNFKFDGFTYGSDDDVGIRESEMLEILSLIERYEECYDENNRFIEKDYKHYYSLVKAVKSKVDELKKKQEDARL